MKSVVFRVALAAVLGSPRRPRRPRRSTRSSSAARSTAARTARSPASACRTRKGSWTGLDVDFCRALAAAIFSDPNKVKFVPLTAKDRFTALQSGEVDVLVAQHHLDHRRATPRSA